MTQIASLRTLRHPSHMLRCFTMLTHVTPRTRMYAREAQRERMVVSSGVFCCLGFVKSLVLTLRRLQRYVHGKTGVRPPSSESVLESSLTKVQ